MDVRGSKKSEDEGTEEEREERGQTSPREDTTSPVRSEETGRTTYVCDNRSGLTRRGTSGSRWTVVK